MKAPLPLMLLAVGLASATSLLPAAEVRVGSLQQLADALSAVSPGDQIVVANGKYDSTGTITIATTGTAERPIVIAAETVGGVEIAGDAGFRLVKPAAYTVVRGFVFTHKAGEMTLEAGVHHCRITRNVFELAVDGRARYLAVNGDDIEIDHNNFRNKSTEGQMLHVQGPGSRGMAQRAWIHHNYFHDFRNSRRNNSSALHIGHSARSMTSSYSVVEHNLFVRTHGENEGAICNKASDNVYRFNTFGEDSTELSLRHGKRCLVYGNFFLGGNGLRFFSHDHRIYSNFFTNCRPAIAIGNGGATIPPGPLTSHERPERVQIVYNTLVDNRENVRMSRRRNGLGATDLVFANNIVVGGNEAVSVDGPLPHAKWEGNLLWDNKGGSGDIPPGGYTEADPRIEPHRFAPYRIESNGPAAGKGVGAYPYATIDLDGQTRGNAKDVGADQISKEPETNRPLTPDNVGPEAQEDTRPWISTASDVAWIPKND